MLASCFMTSTFFKWAAWVITLSFVGALALVSLNAYTRTSGFTGLDAAKIQKIRMDQK